MPLVSLLSESDDPRRPQARLNALKDITPDHGRVHPRHKRPANPRGANSWPIRVRWPSCQHTSLEYAPTRRSGAVPARVRAPMACPVPAHSASSIRSWPGSCDAGESRPRSRPCASTWAERRSTKGRSRPSPSTTPALPGLCSWVAPTAHMLLQGRHLQPRRTTLEPYAPMVTDAPALVQTTLRTGKPSCTRSPRHANTAAAVPGTPPGHPPRHRLNTTATGDAAVIPASPAWTDRIALSKVPPRLQHGSAAGGSHPAT